MKCLCGKRIEDDGNKLCNDCLVPKITKWITVEEYRKQEGLNSRQSALYRIKSKDIETKKEEREVIQKQLVTLVKVNM